LASRIHLICGMQVRVTSRAAEVGGVEFRIEFPGNKIERTYLVWGALEGYLIAIQSDPHRRPMYRNWIADHLILGLMWHADLREKNAAADLVDELLAQVRAGDL
jgi:hypothetical protein